MISMKFLTHRASEESSVNFPQKSFLPLLAAILNFCIKRKKKNMETERDRVISIKFLTHRISVESTGDSSKKLFSRHLWRPS